MHTSRIMLGLWFLSSILFTGCDIAVNGQHLSHPNRVSTKPHAPVLRPRRRTLHLPNTSVRKAATAAVYPTVTTAGRNTSTEGWVLYPSYSDEFSTGVLDTTKWWAGNYGPGWASTYPANPVNVSVGPDPAVPGSGCLILTSNAVTGGYQIGQIWSTGGAPNLTSAENSDNIPMRPGYGFYEVRLKASNSTADATFWLKGQNGQSPDPSVDWETEIDCPDGYFTWSNMSGTPVLAQMAYPWANVSKYPGNTAGSPTVSTCDPFDATGAGNTSSFPVLTDSYTNYHIFGLNWNAVGVTWYLDGVQIGSTITQALPYPGSGNPGNCYPIPMQIVCDSGIWTGWSGTPLDSQLPAHVYYDYIRVWTQPTLTGPTSGNPGTLSAPFSISLNQSPPGGTIVTPSSSVSGDTFQDGNGNTITSVSIGPYLSTGKFYLMPGSTAGARTISLSITTVSTLIPTIPVIGPPITYAVNTSTPVALVLTPVTCVSVPVGTTLTGLATASVFGAFTYTPATATAAVTLNVTANVTPTNTTAYTTASVVVPVTVTAAAKTTPVLSPVTGMSVSVGTTLTGGATANVPGTCTYVTATATVAGTLSVTAKEFRQNKLAV